MAGLRGWKAVLVDLLFRDPGRYGLRRLRYITGDVQSATGPPDPLSHDRDDDVTYLLTDSQEGSGCQGDPAVPGGTCTLSSSSPDLG